MDQPPLSSVPSQADQPSSLPVVGWREWARLKSLGLPWIKAKIDTGAASSSLHALHLEAFTVDDEDWIRFEVHPHQRDDETSHLVESRVLEWRKVRSSSGHVTHRPVIATPVKVGKHVWEIQLTLVNRKHMGFRMLLGREALKGQFVVDVSRSFVQRHKPKTKPSSKTSRRSSPPGP